MKNHIVIDGNAFYEIDEECVEKCREKDAAMRKGEPSFSMPGRMGRTKPDTSRRFEA